MQTEYALLYLTINLVSLALIGIILHRTYGLSKMVAQRNFAMSIIAEMVFFASDTVFVLINEGALDFGPTANNIAMLLCKEVYFFATSLMCFFWFIYFELIRETAFAKEKKYHQYASFAVWLMLILLIVNLFTGILFYIDEDGAYHRGGLFILTYIISYIYVVVACVRTIHNMLDKSYAGDRKSLLLITLFPLAPGLAGICQFIFPRLPVACGVLALTTLVLYLDWIDRLIALDPLPGLNNRKQLNHFYDHWSRNHGAGENIYLLMIDANKFKSINDNYGHIQGDNALKNIAEALRLACRGLPKRANIARYGGDEFAILFEAGDSDTVESLKKSIADTLEDVNRRTGIPFELTVSIGAATSDGTLSLKEFIDLADEAMYTEKKQSGKPSA